MEQFRKDLVQDVGHRHLSPVEFPLPLHHPDLATSLVRQEPEVRAEPFEEILPTPFLRVLLELGTGRVQVGPSGLAPGDLDGGRPQLGEGGHDDAHHDPAPEQVGDRGAHP